MHDFPTSLQPWPGARSGETFLAEVAGEQVVLRIYGAGSASRGPLAPEIDAAVLELVRGLLPVPEVLEVRRGDVDSDLPGILVTSRLQGIRFDELLPRLDPDQVALVGTHLGTLAGRLRHMVAPRRGIFTDRSLVPGGPPPDEELLDEEDRAACLVHGDLSPGNLLLDPDTLEVSGLVGWEAAHSGRPLADLGRLLRLESSATYAEALLHAYRAMVPSTPVDLLERVLVVDPSTPPPGDLHRL